MKYYVSSDIHGFYSLFVKALTDAGYYEDKEPHKLIILGDLFDRGKEAALMQDYILELIEKDEVILVKGNHEDLFEDFVTVDMGIPYDHHVHNGTYDTAKQLTGFDANPIALRSYFLAAAGKNTPYYQKIIPSMIDWYETEHYVFVHGWVPCISTKAGYCAISDWREATENEWKKARWYNGIDASRTAVERKTVVCGHWHASYGHALYEKKGSEFGPDADFSPYYGKGVIAIDACTGFSKKVNCIVIED